MGTKPTYGTFCEHELNNRCDMTPKEKEEFNHTTRCLHGQCYYSDAKMTTVCLYVLVHTYILHLLLKQPFFVVRDIYCFRCYDGWSGDICGQKDPCFYNSSTNVCGDGKCLIVPEHLGHTLIWSIHAYVEWTNMVRLCTYVRYPVIHI